MSLFTSPFNTNLGGGGAIQLTLGHAELFGTGLGWASAMSGISTAAQKITSFAISGAGDGCTANTANDRIDLGYDGTYQINFSTSFDGNPGLNYRFGISTDGGTTFTRQICSVAADNVTTGKYFAGGSTTFQGLTTTNQIAAMWYTVNGSGVFQPTDVFLNVLRVGD
jgi:hypothetical protein